MCGIPDLKIGFDDGQVRFVIELSTPQPQACQRPASHSRPEVQPAPGLQLPMDQLLAVGLPLLMKALSED